MSEILESTKTEVAKCKTTGEIRKVSSALFRSIDDKSNENIFRICGELLDERKWAHKVIAYDLTYKIRAKYDENTFSVFEGWLKNYVRGWGDCDDFCTHAFGELIIRQPHLFSKVKTWTSAEQFWMRRAAAVIFIPSIRQNAYRDFDLFEISDLLLNDQHDLVRKGYGWMLKVLSKKEPDKVIEYLINNREIMPRVAFRYALEDLNTDQKKYLMGL